MPVPVTPVARPRPAQPGGHQHHYNHHPHGYGAIYGNPYGFWYGRTANHYHVQGYGASAAVLWGGIGYGYVPHTFHYGYYNRFGFGFNRFHRGHFGWSYGWFNPYPWHYDAYSISYFGSRWRFNFGFGAHLSPYHYPLYAFPRYRVWNYYPYHYYSTVAFFPGYANCFDRVATVAYVDSHDPYVDFVDEAPVAVATAELAEIRRTEIPVDTPLPEAFNLPLVAVFPDGLAASELIARGQGYLARGDALMAAEAFRRAWLAIPNDAFVPLELALSLSVAGDRDGLAQQAISAGLSRDPERLLRVNDMRTKLRDGADLDRTVDRLQRRLLKEPRDLEARYVLGWLRFHQGGFFEAHTEFSRLKEAGYRDPHLDSFLQLAEQQMRARR